MNPVVYESPSLVSHAEHNAGIIHDRMLSVVLKCHPASLLEIGAGQGKLAAAFVEHGIDYFGIEPVENEIEQARRNYPAIQILRASCYDDPEELKFRKFDVVYSNDIVEHLYEPRKLTSFSRSHLKPGGMIVCGTPHYGSYLRNLLLSVTNRWDHHHNPLWDGGHIKFFSKATLHRLWAEAGFTDFQWGEIRSPRMPLMSMYLYCTARLKD
jgi:2-polyprenyl-6-hydroxyphenyl methylase/3-demethylubiquinone-9 3-methyltransferase